MYGEDVLKGDWRRREWCPRWTPNATWWWRTWTPGSAARWSGFELGAVVLEDRHGKRRNFPLAPAAFLLDGSR